MGSNNTFIEKEKIKNPKLKWEEATKLAKQYSKVVVSGCQRTGTTIISKALCSELEYIYYDERTFKTDNIYLFEEFLRRPINIVFQAPAILHHLPKYQNDCLIIIIERNVDDVKKSMERVGWFNIFGEVEYRKFIPNEKPQKPEDIYEVKMKFADTFENVRMDYDELKKTNYYITDRKNFELKQTHK